MGARGKVSLETFYCDGGMNVVIAALPDVAACYNPLNGIPTRNVCLPDGCGGHVTTQTYQAASRQLLAQARTELAAGDLLERVREMATLWAISRSSAR